MQDWQLPLNKTQQSAVRTPPWRGKMLFSNFETFCQHPHQASQQGPHSNESELRLLYDHLLLGNVPYLFSTFHVVCCCQQMNECTNLKLPMLKPQPCVAHSHLNIYYSHLVLRVRYQDLYCTTHSLTITHLQSIQLRNKFNFVKPCCVCSSEAKQKNI